MSTFDVASNWVDQSTGTTAMSVPGAQDAVDSSGGGTLAALAWLDALAAGYAGVARPGP